MVIVRSGQFFILGAILLSVLFFLGLTLTNTLLTSPKKDISFLSENYKRDLPRAFNLGVLQGQSGRSLGNFTNFTDSVLTQNFINFTAFFVVSEPADNDTVDITIGNFLDSPLSVDIKLDNSGTLGAVGSGNVQSVPGGRRLYLQGEEEPLPLPSPGPGCPSGGRDTLIDSSPQTTCNAGMPPGQTCMVSFNYSDSNDCPAQARVGLGISYDTSPGNEAMLRKANINTSCSPGKVMKIVSTILGCTDGWNCVQYLNGQAGVQDSGNPTPDFANITWILEACPGFGGSYDVANKGVAELGSQINFNDFVSFQLPPPPNSPPDVTGVSTSPDADGNLTCSYSGTSDADGDAVFAHYSWLRDGSPAQALNMPFDTELDGRTYDYSGNNLTGNLTGPSA
ncbi:MAG: hypothetical protein HY367_02975, partial [Candidatus Aenigmarchaeota archaeon]|nr:hypothetical protein [Candidatus Aenigmarchaeota archaeon]